MAELMKGQKWEAAKHRMTYPCAVEKKVDEIRCHVIVKPLGSQVFDVQFNSYAGKPLHNMELFRSGFIDIFNATGFHEYDCGFEVNANFNDSYRWVRSSRGIPDDLLEASTKFILFDLPLSGQSIPFEEREALRVRVYREAYNSLQGKRLNLELPTSERAYSEAEVLRIYSRYTEEGAEGAMVKDLQHPYIKGARTYHWLKLKPENDADGIIQGFTEAVAGVDQPELGIFAGDRLGRVGSILVQVQEEDGKITSAQPAGIAHDLARDMWQRPEKYIGRWCEFKYMERDRAGGYPHPRFFRLREAK